jgi:hypothetical protein
MKNNQKLLISFDVDGVLNHYPIPFIEYVNIELSTCFLSIPDIKLGLGEEKYRELKFKYRTSDFKYQIPIDEAVRDLLNDLSKKYPIFLFTRRPFSQFEKMYERTIDWLKINHVDHSGLFYKSVENFSNKNVAIHVDDQIDDVNMLKVVRGTKFIVLSHGVSNEDITFCPTKDDLGDVLLTTIAKCG